MSSIRFEEEEKGIPSDTFDKFHLVKLLNEAINKVRKAEAREHAILKRHKYAAQE